MLNQNLLLYKTGDYLSFYVSAFSLGLQPAYRKAASKSSIMNFPANLRYTKDHEWVSLDGNIATIGITDFAQGELGDIVYIEVETIGKELEAGAVFGTVEAVKTVSDLFLPVSGTITELNPALGGTPESVNSDPYGEGWMVKMKVDNPADVEALMDVAAYKALVA
jgi:glycine cleavage system H protein